VGTYGPMGQAAGNISEKLTTGDRGVSQAWGDGMAARVAVALLVVDFWVFFLAVLVVTRTAFFLKAEVREDASAEAAEAMEAWAAFPLPLAEAQVRREWVEGLGEDARVDGCGSWATDPSSAAEVSIFESRRWWRKRERWVRSSWYLAGKEVKKCERCSWLGEPSVWVASQTAAPGLIRPSSRSTGRMADTGASSWSSMEQAMMLS
jgi:hypothetical protein